MLAAFGWFAIGGFLIRWVFEEGYIKTVVKYLHEFGMALILIMFFYEVLRVLWKGGDHNGAAVGILVP